MIKSRKRGSILFELFMALMILSIAIANTLRVFSETLFVGQKNIERAEAKKAVEHLMFEWTAHPWNASFAGSGSITIPFENGASGYQCEIRSQKIFLSSQKPTSESQKEDSNVIQRPNSYYQVHFHVTRSRGTPVFDFETILTKANQ
jgi:hypothetical protein